MAKMKAALMYGPNDVRIEQIDKPECPEDGLLFNVKAVGLCGSDIRNLTTDSRKGKYPWLYGHEHAGVIAEMGPQLEQEYKDKFKVGDRVFVSPFGYGKTTGLDGGFSEFRAIHGETLKRCNVLPVADDFKLEYATLAEPLSSTFSCQEAVNIRSGQSVVILGAGPIGVFQAELAKLRGASKVIMIELSADRLEMAKNFAIDYAINGAEVDAIQAVKDLTDGVGADVVISANPSGKGQQQAIYMVRGMRDSMKKGGTNQGGVVVFFGGIPKGQMVELDTNYIHYNGIWVYGHEGFTLPQNLAAFNIIANGYMKAEKFVSRIMPLDDINEALELAKAGKIIKAVLNP